MRIKVVIFIPGIAGSVLWREGDWQTMWPMKLLWKDIILGASPEDVKVFSNPTTQLMAIRGFRDEDFPPNINPEGRGSYTPLIQRFGDNRFNVYEKRPGFEEWSLNKSSNELRFFWEWPYDWRKSAKSNAVVLADFIRNVVIKTISDEFPNPELDLYPVAHSMGGLPLRYSLSLEENKDIAGLIRKQFFIATPHHGAPKAYHILRTGTGFLEKWYIDWRISDLRPLLTDLPSLYELLPSEQYTQFSNSLGYMPLFTFKGKEYSIKDTYLSSGDNPYALSNDGLVINALSMHDQLKFDNYLPGGETHLIYGNGLKTCLGSLGLMLSRGQVFMWGKCGDGTVPYWSASGLENCIKVGFQGLSHNELPVNDLVLNYIINEVLGD